MALNIHLERIAINTIDGREDNTGFKPNGEKFMKMVQMDYFLNCL